MWGYRLVRESDDRATRQRIVALEADVRTLLEARTTWAVEATAAKARADYATLRCNVLEAEVAAYRQRATGVPQIAPHLQTERGDPMSEALLGLEDVGDGRAADLAARGLLHDLEDLGDLQPSARQLVPGDDEE
jgi:hypothetical protein